MSERNDDIGKILAEFQNQKQNKDNPNSDAESNTHAQKEVIDFARKDEPEKEKKNKAKKEKKKRVKKKRVVKKPNLKKVFNKKFFTVLGIIVLVIGIITGAVFGINYAVNQSKVAYLKPYQEKYPKVNFPVGIMEEYCDLYGENQNTNGFIKISDLSFESAVFVSENEKVPYNEQNTRNAEIFNYVVYMQNNDIEKLYKDADSYNASSGFIEYSNLFTDDKFMVVGAFYTNTKAKDDDGYIFPYNVTEVMTNKSYSNYIDMLSKRFIYNTGITITRKDIMLTISCPTDYKKDYRFVVVGVMRNEETEKPTAAPKKNYRLTHSEYQEKKIENPYTFSTKWYPEIIIKDGSGNQSTVTQSIKDYE